MKDIATIVGLTVGGCLVVGLIGGWLLHLLRRRSFRHLLTVATLIPVVAVVVTVIVNVKFMFLSAHDSAVVLVALGTALLLAVVAVSTLVTLRYRGANLGRIYGLISVGMGLGGSLGAWIGGVLHDLTGGYTAVMIFSALSLLMAAGSLTNEAAAREKRSLQQSMPGLSYAGNSFL